VPNIFGDLSDLPDKPRLGLRLIAGGLALGLVRLSWPHVAPSSYRGASELFAHTEPYLPRARVHSPSIDDFGIFLVAVVAMLVLYGAFIFFRRGFWWVAEHRSDDKSVTEIGLK
jgi:hypothetical protein